MTFLGKVLVVFQMLASMIFMCFAAGVYSVHTKWREKYTQQDTATKKAQADFALEQGEHEKTRREEAAKVAAAKTDLEKAQGELANATQELAAAKLRETQRAEESAKNQEQAQIAMEEADTRSQNTLQQRELNKQLHETRAALAKKNTELEDQLKGLTIDLAAAKAKNSELIRQVGRMTTALAQHKISVDNLVEGGDAPPPPVDGVVVDTQPARGSGSSELVTISLGADDRIRKGHQLSVFRSSRTAGGTPKYLGKIEIIRTLPDKAVGIVVERAGNGVLQKGDNVTTKL